MAQRGFDLTWPLWILAGLSFATSIAFFAVSTAANQPSDEFISSLAMGICGLVLATFGLLWCFAPYRVRRWDAYVERSRAQHGARPMPRSEAFRFAWFCGLGGLSLAFTLSDARLLGDSLRLLTSLLLLAPLWGPPVLRHLRRLSRFVRQKPARSK